MAIIKRMYPEKDKEKSKWIEYFEAENKKRADRMIADYEKQLKEEAAKRQKSDPK